MSPPPKFPSAGSPTLASSSLASPLQCLTADKRALVRKHVGEILSCYRTLAALPSLQPCESVNEAFESLVAVCSQTPEEATVHAILKDPRVESIVGSMHRMCSDGEFWLEKYWADKIFGAGLTGTAAASLAKFPYYSNYADLTRMELSIINLASPHRPPERFAFLGCGPLPLTSLCILHQLQPRAPALSILNLDYDYDALATAARLCRRLNYPASAMTFRCDNARALQSDLADFDVVYVAALVGAEGPEKREVFAAVLERMRPGALLVIRTAHALRTLLYPAVRPATDLDPELFEPIMVVHPYNHIINSVIIGRAR